MFETSKHVLKTEECFCVFKNNYNTFAVKTFIIIHNKGSREKHPVAHLFSLWWDCFAFEFPFNWVFDLHTGTMMLSMQQCQGKCSSKVKVTDSVIYLTN